MVAAAVIGGAVIGAGASMIASGNAADAQKSAAAQASATQMGMFNQIQQNEAPWVGTGSQANAALAQFYGLGGLGSSGGAGSTGLVGNGPSGPGGRLGVNQGMTPGGTAVYGGGQPTQQTPTPGMPDYNKILSGLPGYQFQLQQGQLATQHNLAARGLLGSGAAEKSLDTFGQGLAQNYASQYTQGLQNLSQMGEAGAAGVASAGMNAANQSGAYSLYGGNAGAAGYANQSNAIGQGLSGLVGAYGNYNAQQNAMYGPPYTGATNGYTASGGTDAGYNNFLNSVYSP